MKTIRYRISKQVLQQLIISNLVFGLMVNIDFRSFDKNVKTKFITKKSTATLKPYLVSGYTLKFPIHSFFFNCKKISVISYLNKFLSAKHIVLVKINNQFFFNSSFLSSFLSVQNCFTYFNSTLELGSNLKSKFVPFNA